jgi:hypothetical protein
VILIVLEQENSLNRKGIINQFGLRTSKLEQQEAFMKLHRVIITAFFALFPLAVAQTTPTQASYDALEELAGRIIGYGYSEPELLVGKLPSERLKLEIPVLEGSRILGTSIRNDDNFEVVMDVRGDAKAILDFYRGKLKDWEDKGEQNSGPRGGFLFSSSEINQKPYTLDTLLCQNQWSFSVVIHRLDAAIKDVRLRIDKYTCGFYAGGIELPKLFLPTDAEPQDGSSGFGGDVFSSLTLSANLTLPQLFEHYAAQLEKANWKLGDKITLKNGILASYELKSAKGEPWAAILTILPAKGGLFNAALRAYPL